ncbi:MAG: hypothetical protein HY695_07660, partial [Deltaproteobacteria bacterium]|nr:hypothetical protein [Deltaproteobacteria bacterium]
GKTIVFAADRMVTAGYISLEFEHQEKKVETIKDFCVVMSSGDALVAFELVERLKKESTPLKTVAEIADKLYKFLTDLSLKRAEQKYLLPRGLDWESYRERAEKINPQLYMILDEYLSNFTLETDFLVAGIDEYGGHVITIDFPGTIQYLDKIGFGAVGSGIPHTTVSLCLDGQTRNRPLPETIYAVYVSKRKAQSAPGVGAETDMGVITSGGIRFLEPQHLEKLGSLYDGIMGQQTDVSLVKKICEEINSKK